MQVPVRKKVELSSLKVNPQVRLKLNPERVREMSASLEQHGQLNDLAAQATGELIYGHYRLAAMQALGWTHAWVQVYEEPLSRAAVRLLQISENQDRTDLKPYELALAVHSLIEEDGLQLKDIAERMSKSAAWVTRYGVYPFKCIAAVREQFEAGRIGVTDCEVFAKSDPQQQHVLLAARLGEGGQRVTRDDLVRRTRKRKRETDNVQVARIRFPLSAGGTIALAGEGLTLTSAVELMVDGLKELRRALTEGRDARNFMAEMQRKFNQKGG